MTALRDLQATIRDAILGGDERAAAWAIAGDGLPSARLEIYRITCSTVVLASWVAHIPEGTSPDPL
jgi:hypothetical protein